MRLLISLLFLALPIVEILILLKMGSIRVWLPFLWVLIGISAGWFLIWQERALFVGRLFGALQARATLPQILFQTGRRFIAGVLFIMPGVVSDIAALTLLLWPIRGPAMPPRAANDEVIEGTFRRESEPRLRKPE